MPKLNKADIPIFYCLINLRIIWGEQKYREKNNNNNNENIDLVVPNKKYFKKKKSCDS